MGGKPTITIRGEVLTVNDSARNVMQVMKLVREGMTVEAVLEAATLVFEPKSRKALDRLDLSFHDFAEVVNTAVNLILGDDQEGEAETPATT